MKTSLAALASVLFACGADAPKAAAPLSSEGARQEVNLIWTVEPPQGQGQAETRNVQLVVRHGDVVHRLPLGPQHGALLPSHLSICGPAQIAYKKEPDEVAKIVFGLAGTSVFIVKRATPSLLEVVSVEGPDGYCPQNDCDTVRILAKVPVPANARTNETIREVESDGREHPFECEN